MTHHHERWTAAIVLLLTAGTAAPLSAQFPSEPPPPLALSPLRFPPFREVRLRNGLELVLVENRRLPVVSITLSIPTGGVNVAPTRRGLDDLVAELLTKGTTSRSAEEIAAAIEGAGGSLSASAGQDFFTITATILADRAGLAFELMGDVLRHATFPADELELARRRFLSALQVEKSQPEAIADRYFARAIYGEHPYGGRASEAPVRAITREDVQAWAREQLRPEGALLVIAGDLGLEQARGLAERHLGAWRGRVPARSYGTPPLPQPTEILLIHRPGSEQSNIVVGNLGLRPGVPDYYPATVANRVLGGGADARLFMILREQKSWTYGAYSRLNRPFDVGTFEATAEVRTAVTDSALTELLAQLRRIRTEAIPESELVAAKGFLTGVFPLTIETPQQVAGQVATQKRLRLGDDYLQRYRERIQAVTAGQAQRAIRAVIRPDSAVIVVVGDGQRIYEPLAAIAPVRVIDVNGDPLDPAALAAPVGRLPLESTRLLARRDSFQVVIQGSPMGGQVTELRREGGTLTYREQTNIPIIGLTQESQVVMDGATLDVRSVEQRGQAGGQAVETLVVVQGGRATGRAQTPDPSGQPKVVEVDTTLAAGTLEVNQLQAIVPALPLADGASFTAAVFNASDASIKPFTITVGGAEAITVPAGTFQAFRVSLTGGRLPVVLYVTEQPPRRIIRVEVIGQPIVFELVQ